MHRLTGVFTVFFAIGIVQAGIKAIDNDLGGYQDMLQEIDKEQNIVSMLVAASTAGTDDLRLEVFYRFAKPKVIVNEKGQDFIFREYFNTEMLTVLLNYGHLDLQMLEMVAQILDAHRQTRILIVALDIHSEEQFRKACSEACKRLKMTRVLLSFLYSPRALEHTFYTLRPYPQYHWTLELVNASRKEYFPTYWLNMHNATLVTFMPQDSPQSLVYEADDGTLKMNGFITRLVMLYAEKFNASLQMYEPLSVGKAIHYRVVNQMANASLLDIPMALDLVLDQNMILQQSAYFELTAIEVIVPCAGALTVEEIFALLLNGYFFGCVAINVLLFSVAHSLIDYYFQGIAMGLNFMLNDRIMPGVLGLAFKGRHSPRKTLKLVYILVSFTGLNLATQFGAHINTLFTSPPTHKAIDTFEDLHRSAVKVLMDEMDTRKFGYIRELFGSSLLISTNSSFVLEHKNKFNHSFGYLVSTATWDLFVRRQQFDPQNSFCRMKGLEVFPGLAPFSVDLQENSPHKQPLDYLIYRVHEVGLKEAWQASTFLDLMRLKKIPIHDQNPSQEVRALQARDLLWIWLIVIIGCGLSLLMFFLELCLDKY
uniref:Ionotropic receptor n=1 Tax=Stomoxys calcitrans TaxID=35570 RepID=A0A1I8NYG7_STOCA